MAPATFDLARFKRAQERTFDAALAELRAGRKTTHWIWWVFPQLAGLGSSTHSVQYALAGRAEACAYLRDDVLRERLVAATQAVHEQLLGPKRPALDALMGSGIDALKLVSSLTLFAEVATDVTVRELPGVDRLGTIATEILEVARGLGYPACEPTLTALRSR